MTSYDEVPYPAMTYSYTHPDRLAVVGRLMGLEVASPEHCRVLDLGCGSGANVIAMAELLPESEFAGIDQSGRQIEQGRAMVDRLGLRNVDLQQADIMELPDTIGRFDYVIAHGLYSWVPEPVRDKTLRLIRQCLAPQGIAYVSYNAYPGWHQLDALRDMMRFRVRDIDEPSERARAARDFVALVAGAQTGPSPFGDFVRQYYATALGRGEVPESFLVSTLMHDELGEVNQPFYFSEFMEAATAAGLEFLAEADLEGGTAVGLPPKIRDQLGSLARDRVEMEQYLDFVRNRGFRKTLLCHREAPVSRTLQANAKALAGMYVSSSAKQQRGRKDDGAGVMRFAARDGMSYATNHAPAQRAFRYMGALYPRVALFEDVVEEACPGEAPREADALAAALLRNFLLSRSLVELHVAPRQLQARPGRRPHTPAFARLMAADGEARVTNLRHETVELTPLASRLVPLLDGGHSLPELVDAVSNGGAAVPEATIKAELRSLAGAGLLMA